MIIGDSEKNHRILCSVEWSYAEIYCKFFTATLQVKVFAWSPFGNQLFWFRETVLLSKLPAPKF